MSFLPSLLLYNPLEAFIILLFCNVCSGTKTKTRIILDSYILGTLNFVVQYPNMLLDGSLIQMVYNIFSVLILMSITVYICFHKKYNFKICIGSSVFILISTTFLMWFVNSFIKIILINKFYNGIDELVFNLILRVLQIFLIFILYKGKCLYEKVSQKDG